MFFEANDKILRIGLRKLRLIGNSSVDQIVAETDLVSIFTLVASLKLEEVLLLELLLLDWLPISIRESIF